MKNVEIVIAKYKEDIDWTEFVSHPVTIYDKSENPLSGAIPLPNIGREAHTFLYHIVTNYENLADVTLFIQGNPFEHVNSMQSYSAETIRRINNITKDMPFQPFDRELWIEEDYENWFLSDIFKTDTFKFSPGAQYIVPKANILQRPLILWKKLLDMSDTNTMNDTNKICPWTFERIWMCLFNGMEINPDFFKA